MGAPGIVPGLRASEDTAMPTGTIARLLIDKGFGFIRDEGGIEHFFHRSAVRGAVFELLREGQRVEFSVRGLARRAPRRRRSPDRKLIPHPPGPRRGRDDVRVPVRPLTSSPVGKLRRIFLIVIVAGVALGAYAFNELGAFLAREDPLETADAIFVLAGTQMTRPLEGADLFLAGYAPRIVLTREGQEPALSVIARKGLGIPTDAERARDVLCGSGHSTERDHLPRPHPHEHSGRGHHAARARRRKWLAAGHRCVVEVPPSACWLRVPP